MPLPLSFDDLIAVNSPRAIDVRNIMPLLYTLIYTNSRYRSMYRSTLDEAYRFSR